MNDRYDMFVYNADLSKVIENFNILTSEASASIKEGLDKIAAQLETY